MARAYVDDSGSGGDSRYYVLAGFKAASSTWDLFTIDWLRVLSTPPSVDFFKMQQAAGRSGQFEHFSVKDRDAKVNALTDVIEKHELFAFSSAISQDDYDLILKPIVTPQYDSPYIFAFNFVLTAFSSHQAHYVDGAKVDFVFDIQSGEKAARKYYEQARHLKPLKDRIGTITYCDDKQCVPLQAADLIAWQRRRRLCVASEGTRPEYARLHKDPSRYLLHVWDRADLYRQAQSIKTMVAQLNAGTITPQDLLNSRK